MKYTEVNITTTRAGKEFVELTLLSANITGWQVIDFDEMREFLGNNPKLWDYIDDRVFAETSDFVTIRIYTSDDEIGKNIIKSITDEVKNLKQMMSNVDFGPLTITQIQVDDENWLDCWKKYFKPFEVGNNIVIRPTWEEYSNPQKVVMAIDPGNVFGTGHHETTRLCVKALETFVKSADVMLDLGCGSGILSVIGLLLGAESCVCIDYNPNAAATVYKNAEINGIAKDRIIVYTDDILQNRDLRVKIGAQKYDCIVANIVADAIIDLSPKLAELNCLKPAGVFIASGIISERSDEVLSALTNSGFNIIETQSENEWICLVSGFKKGCC